MGRTIKEKGGVRMIGRAKRQWIEGVKEFIEMKGLVFQKNGRRASDKSNFKRGETKNVNASGIRV